MLSLVRIVSVPAHLLLGLFLRRQEVFLNWNLTLCLRLTYSLSESQALPGHFKYSSMVEILKLKLGDRNERWRSASRVRQQKWYRKEKDKSWQKTSVNQEKGARKYEVMSSNSLYSHYFQVLTIPRPKLSFHSFQYYKFTWHSFSDIISLLHAWPSVVTILNTYYSLIFPYETLVK